MRAPRARSANSLIGSPIERLEDVRFLRGRGQFVDDIDCAGLLHAAILRSSVAHGRIRSIDTAAALALPGVHAVITAAEIVGSTVPTIPLRQELLPVFKRFEQPVIAQGKVRYVGEPIAVVLADSAGAGRGRARCNRPRHRAFAGGGGPRRVPSRRCASVRGERHQSARHVHGAARRRRGGLPSRAPMCGASASRCSGTPRCPWSRADCWRNGTRRPDV